MLTKSDFLKYIQCKKALYLSKNRKDLIVDIDDNQQKIFDTGYEVETYAYQLFPGGVNVQFDDFKKSISDTEQLLKNRTDIIYQASVLAGDLYARLDILCFNKEADAWDIYEVKSSTKLKDINLYDLAFQVNCLNEAGYKVNRAHLVLINNEYARKGEIDASKLLKIEDLSSEVFDLQEDIANLILEALNTVKATKEIDVPILKQCNDPYPCPFMPYCFQDLPKNSIYDLAGALSESKLKYLLDLGITEIKDIPDNFLTNSRAIIQRQVIKENKTHIDKDAIKDFLSQLKYPLYFIDYETNAPAIPLFDNYRPYQRMVFQYSLHIQLEKGGKVIHKEFLADKYEEPSKTLAISLKGNTGKEGSLISWNMAFEKSCNNEMAIMNPEFADFFEDMNNRMIDLMDIFKKSYYVHQDFLGSASIKKVLPVLVPELSYQDLSIQEGVSASNQWIEMISDKVEIDRKKIIYDNLLEYCKLDTLAMLKILEKIYQEVL